MKRVKFLHSIQAKVILAAGLVFSILMAVTTFFTIRAQHAEFIKAKRRHLDTLVHVIEQSLIHSMEEGRCDDIQITLEMIGQSKDVNEVRIMYEDGTIFKSKNPSEVGRRVSPDYVKALQTQRSFVLTGKDGDMSSYGIVKSIMNRPSCYGCHDRESETLGILNVGVTLTDIEDHTLFIERVMVTHALTTLVAMAIVGILLHYRLVTRPIKRLMVSMAHVQKGNFDAKADVHSRDELGILAESFNSMVAKLEKHRKEFRKYYEQEIARQERLASLGEFATGIAHEIRNPLAGIGGALQVLSGEYRDDDPRKEIVDEILYRIQELDVIVKEILTYSRFPEPEMVHTDMNAVVEGALTFFVSSGTEHIKVLKNLQPELPPVLVDPTQMRQALLNIFLNSYQAMGGTGEIQIETSLETVDGSKRVVVEIGDSGPGISEDMREKIFKPFVSTKPQGTGLGLAVVNRIIEQNNGTIHVKSGTPRGAIFIITLPVHEVTQNSSEDR